ncbi:hypothetical protein AAE478_001015 [Parahypoxylon ruwenzoriense]
MIALRSLLSVTCLLGCVIAAPVAEKRATSRTSPPSGCISVQTGKSGNGYYSTLSDAVASLSGTASACIFVYSGTYTEQVTITYGGPLTIYGYTTENEADKVFVESVGSYKNNVVTFTHSLSSPAAGNLDASSTIQVKSADFKMYNINVKNTYGKGAQAVALTANADRLGFYGCGFYGYQDT